MEKIFDCFRKCLTNNNWKIKRLNSRNCNYMSREHKWVNECVFSGPMLFWAFGMNRKLLRYFSTTFNPNDPITECNYQPLLFGFINILRSKVLTIKLKINAGKQHFILLILYVNFYSLFYSFTANWRIAQCEQRIQKGHAVQPQCRHFILICHFPAWNFKCDKQLFVILFLLGNLLPHLVENLLGI